MQLIITGNYALNSTLGLIIHQVINEEIMGQDGQAAGLREL